jgi:hypothetical protein
MTNYTFRPNIGTTYTAPGTIIIMLPDYDVGWVLSQNNIRCQITNTFYNCIPYPGADYVRIALTGAQSITPGDTITLYNLQVPRYSIVPPMTVFRWINGATGAEVTGITQSPSFPAITVPPFASASLTVDKKGAGQINVIYTFVFSPPFDIPAGATVIITFPPGYDLTTSNPPVRFSSPDLVDISPSQTVSFSSSISSVNVDGFRTVRAATTFTIVVSGVKSPTGMAISTPYIA